MSDYTTQIRWLRSSNFDFGLNDYPIFDSNYRETLNNKILDHYNFREIGFETASMFKFYLNRTLKEIMPYYNQLYKSETLSFNPLYNVDLTEKLERENLGEVKGKTDYTNLTENDFTQSSSSDTDSSNYQTQIDENVLNQKHVQSDTPQALLSIGNIDGDIYASLVNINKDKTDYESMIEGETKTNTISNDNGNSETNQTSDTNSLTNISNLEEYTKHIIGTNGSKYPSDLLNNFRTTFLNIDMMIINDLSNLFMLIF